MSFRSSFFRPLDGPGRVPTSWLLCYTPLYRLIPNCLLPSPFSLLPDCLQDAHELFCGLLDSLQTEVLAREAARLGRTRIRVSETSDPAARNFGFAVRLWFWSEHGVCRVACLAPAKRLLVPPCHRASILEWSVRLFDLVCELSPALSPCLGFTAQQRCCFHCGASLLAQPLSQLHTACLPALLLPACTLPACLLCSCLPAGRAPAGMQRVRPCQQLGGAVHAPLVGAA